MTTEQQQKQHLEQKDLATTTITTASATTTTTMTTTTTCAVTFLITGASRGFGRAVATVACRFFAEQDHRHHATTEEESLESSTTAAATTNLRFILTARSIVDLEETEREIKNEFESVVPSSQSSSSLTVFVKCYAMDLSDMDSLDDNMDILLDSLVLPRKVHRHHGHHHHHRIFFINNHGSLGHLGRCIDSPSLKDMRSSIDLNVTSCLWMTVRFTRRCTMMMCNSDDGNDNVASSGGVGVGSGVGRMSHNNEDMTTNSSTPSTSTSDYSTSSTRVDATVVNISSLIAVADNFPTMAIYGAGKAAREKYHTILAKELDTTTTTTTTTSTPVTRSNENQEDPSTPIDKEQTPDTITTSMTSPHDNGSGIIIKSLNYAPGPLETSMTESLTSSTGLQKDLQSFFQQKQNLLDPKDSALKLLQLLDSNDFENGAHVDYYDLPGPVGQDNR